MDSPIPQFDKATTKYVSLMMTHQCNLNCIYCYEKNKSSKTMPVEVAMAGIERTFGQAAGNKAYKALEISFMGGEPLLQFEEIRRISEWVWSRQWPLPYILFATTNGTLLDDAMKQWLAANKHKFVLGLSIDGNLSVQELNRGSRATSIDTNFFLSTWPNQSVKATISPQSLPNLAEGIVYLHEQGFKEIHANLAFGAQWQHGDLKEYQKQLLLLADYYIQHPDVKPCSQLRLILEQVFDFGSDYTKHCGCGVGTTLIDCDGKEYPCAVFSPVTLPQSRIAGLKQIDFSDAESFVMDNCKRCILHRTCPKCYGINYLQSGSPKTQPPFLCAAYKIQVLANGLFNQRLLRHGRISKERSAIIEKSLNTIQYYFC